MDEKHADRVKSAGESENHDAAELSRGIWDSIASPLKQGFEKLNEATKTTLAHCAEMGKGWHSEGKVKDGIDRLSMSASINVSAKEFEAQNPGLKGSLAENLGKDGFKARHASTGEIDGNWRLSGINKDSSVRLSKDYHLEVKSKDKHAGLIESRPGVPDELVERLQKKLDQLPANVLQALSDKGYKIIATRTNTDAIPELTGLTPRGWPKNTTFDDSDGTHDNVRKVILAPLMMAGGEPVTRDDVVVHQIGHALDHAFGRLSNAPEFQEAFKKDMAAMNADWFKSSHQKAIYNYFNQNEGPGKDERPGSEECFASLFGLVLTGPENPSDRATFEKYFPNSIAVVRKQIEKI